MTNQENREHYQQQLNSMDRYRGVEEFEKHIEWLEQKLKEAEDGETNL